MAGVGEKASCTESQLGAINLQDLWVSPSSLSFPGSARLQLALAGAGERLAEIQSPATSALQV